MVTESKFEKPTFIIQTILGFVGLGTLIGFIYFSALQHNDSVEALKTAKRNFDSTNLATKKSLALAESANVMTNQSLEHSRESFIIENRPWVGIESVLLDTFLVGKKLWVNVSIKNYGKTPALDLKEKGFLAVYLTSTYDGFKLPNRLIKESEVLSPTQDVGDYFFSGIAMRDQDSIAFVQNKVFLYAYGKITYSDDFGSKDTTTYCGVYNFSAKQFMISHYYNTMK